MAYCVVGDVGCGADFCHDGSSHPLNEPFCGDVHWPAVFGQPVHFRMGSKRSIPFDGQMASNKINGIKFEFWHNKKGWYLFGEKSIENVKKI